MKYKMKYKQEILQLGINNCRKLVYIYGNMPEYYNARGKEKNYNEIR